MKTTLLLIITVMATLQSCSQKQAVSEVSSYKNKVVLGAFNDMIAPTSFNKESLSLLPTIVNFSDKMTAVKNQGHRGTCTFFAATALIESAIKIDLGIDVNLSEEYLIYSTKNQGYYSDVEASHISVNLQSIKTGGIVLEKDWSYFPSFFSEGKPCEGIDGENTQASMDCYVHTPTKSVLDKVIPANSIKTGFIRKNTNEMIKYLAKNERPLTISLPVNYKGWKDSGEVSYTEEMRQECLQNPSECGAHSVVVTGYNLDEKIFFFKNSWGDDWGQNGFGTLSFEMVDRYVDGYLYYAKVEGDLKIPENHQEDKLNLEDLKLEASLEKDLNIDFTFKNTDANGRYIEIQNILAVKYINIDGEVAIEPISIPPEGQEICKSYYLQITGDSLAMDLNPERLSHRMSLPGHLFQYDNVVSMLEIPNSELVVVTEMFLYTDRSTRPDTIYNKVNPVTR